jgi:hypothetical protein
MHVTAQAPHNSRMRGASVIAKGRNASRSVLMDRSIMEFSQ